MVEKTTVFSDFVALLPNNRRGHCPREYLHVKNSFQRFVLPHVDADLMKKVRATEWLRNEDGTEILPPQLGGPRSLPGPGGPGPLGPGRQPLRQAAPVNDLRMPGSLVNASKHPNNPVAFQFSALCRGLA